MKVRKEERKRGSDSIELIRKEYKGTSTGKVFSNNFFSQGKQKRKKDRMIERKEERF